MTTTQTPPPGATGHPQLGGECEVVHQRIAAAHRVHTVGTQPVETELGCRHVAVDGEPGSGQRATSERALPRRLDGKQQTSVIAVEHPDIRQQVMRQAHGLCPLHVRVSGHQRVEVLRGPREQCFGQHLDRVALRPAVLPDPQERVGDHLVVATPTRMQAPTSVACNLGEASFHGGVNVLVTRQEDEYSGGHLRLDRHEAGIDHRGVVCVDNPLRTKHACVSARPADVFVPEALIDWQ